MNQRLAIAIPLIGMLVLGLAIPGPSAQGDENEVAQSHRLLMSQRLKEINRAIRSNQPGPNGEDVRNDPIHGNLTRVLVTELHFIRNVCEPDEEEFTAIAQDGAKWVREFPTVGRTLSLREPDLRNLVTSALAESVVKHLPESVVQNYRAEIDARMAARHRAVASLITSLVDQDAVLSTGQFSAIESNLYETWKPDWPEAATIALNGLSAVLPGWSSTKTHLSPVQRELWRYRGKQKSRGAGRAVQYDTLNLFNARVEPVPQIQEAAK